MPVILLVLLGLLAGSAHAESAVTQRLNSQRLDLQQSGSEAAEAWGLSEQEWSRFEEIQRGPRSYWSPNLDPLTALGVEAHNDAERQRYAELQVRLEAQRAERELAYQRAYDDAWQRVYPGLLPIQGATTPLHSPVAATPVASRLQLFVKPDCSPCLQRVRELLSRNADFDLHLVDSQNDDNLLRDWARQAGIHPARVQRQQITLNHDRGQWQGLGKDAQLPASFQQREGQWQRLD
jgi:integrating conjugative element protein (TIGR03759 family)